MKYVIGYRCIRCGRETAITGLLHQCEHCRGELEVALDLTALARDLSPKDIRRRGSVIWQRWREFLPIGDAATMERISLSEYESPLLRSPRLAQRLGVEQVFIKNDSYFPTASLKDRSMPIAVAKAVEFGASTVCIETAGNAGSALAAYATRARLEAVIFCSFGNVPRSQLAYMLTCGAKVILPQRLDEQGPFQYLEIAARHGWYACDGPLNPFRLEGKKTLAYAIWDQLGARMPDRIAMPLYAGSMLVAIWKGLQELLALGFIKATSKLTGVQPEAAAPIVRALGAGADEVTPIQAGTSLTIDLGDPGPLGNRALRVLKEGDGDAIVASDEEIVEAVRLLGSEGLFVEPAGAIALAGLIRLHRDQRLDGDEEVVVIVTGHGLKNPDRLEAYRPRPVHAGPTVPEIERALGIASAVPMSALPGTDDGY